MRVFIFEKDNNIIGVIGAPEDMILSDDHIRRIVANGIHLTIRYLAIPKNDGDLNRIIDSLIEKNWI